MKLTFPIDSKLEAYGHEHGVGSGKNLDGVAALVPLQQRKCFLYLGIHGFTFLWERVVSGWRQSNKCGPKKLRIQMYDAEGFLG